MANNNVVTGTVKSQTLNMTNLGDITDDDEEGNVSLSNNNVVEVTVKRQTLNITNQGDITDDDDKGNVSLWAGNFSIYWLLATLIGLWFIFIHTPQHITAKGVQDYGVVFWMHITLACFTYIACMWNVFHTPSHGPWYANIHILVGRTAVFTSLVGFSLGMVAAWGPGSTTSFGFAIGITSGGIGQIICTIIGFSAIKLHQWEKEKPVPDEKWKQRYLRIHIGTMLGLFFPSCGVPAVMRIFEMVGMKMQVGLPVGLTIFAIMIPLTTQALDKKRWY